jgi:zinc transporter, ZIP family
MNILIAFIFTLIAGLATGIGGLFAFSKLVKKPSFFAASLGFSAGVMLYVSFMEIMPKGYAALVENFSESASAWISALGFFIGIAFIMIIDFLIPKAQNPHEITDAPHQDQSLLRMGLFSAFAIALHNFPEGLATFYAALDNVRLGLAIMIAIALHNIPEGIAIALPIFQATNNRKKAFYFALISGLAEPVGAIIGFIIFSTFLPSTIFGMVFPFVAGIMVYISLDELLPTAEKYGKHHISMLGLIAGMAVMALSLLLL